MGCLRARSGLLDVRAGRGGGFGAGLPGVARRGAASPPSTDDQFVGLKSWAEGRHRLRKAEVDSTMAVPRAYVHGGVGGAG